MKFLFNYNWMVRDEWFAALQKASHEELIQSRTGGLGNILHTLYHIVVVEHNWICDLKGVPILDLDFSSYDQLDKIIALSQKLHADVEPYLNEWDDSLEIKVLHMDFPSSSIHCTYGEALRHIIAHEIHHMGQLSVWAREIGIQPVSSNLIHRGIMIQS
ncbi:DinB family protein [Muricauda sp. CAU 1633]|uniref:DinB family protein n=1 Tax=Allomuricauda sp. CAU 1633 TaxID=2816036 RepID=UPI001A8C0DC0|nr:DinB family protein [Muricauda sp. CAU 1633]MBO0322413.1 DinB family protein [Muricauda sp. CAU 1633]